MNKLLIRIFLFSALLCGCNLKTEDLSVEKPDLEMEVINDVLAHLIPEHPPCMPAMIKGETNEEYDNRLQAFYDEVDSVGKKVEIVSLLTKLDSNYIETYKRMESSDIVTQLLNSPNKERRIDSMLVRKLRDIEIILVEEPRSTEGAGLTDCYTLGQVNISRVGFNKDSTRAAFSYFVDNGSCFIEDGGIINAELKNGRWQIIK